MWHHLLKWSIPAQAALLVLLFVLISQQKGGGEALGPFPPPPPAARLVGESRIVRQGYVIVDDLRFGGVDRGAVVISEGRFGNAVAHRFPASPLPAERALTLRDGRRYRFWLESLAGDTLTLVLLEAPGGRP